ncbi:MAG: amino acid ABC transporter permease [Geminicoccaceae bacterium]|nr:amino acid ABC transporter permease [Geminicoccaceae bacterium]
MLDFGLIIKQMPAILAAFGVTFGIWIVSMLLAAALGFLVAVARRFGPKPLDWLLRAYVEVFRGTPFLVQLFLLYFGGPYVGLSLEPIPVALLAMTVYGGAYFSEIFRAGFEAVPRGHVEAAECVGLTRAQILRRILVPEMTMLVLPLCVNMAIVLLKETAVLSIITVPELTLVIGVIGSQQYAFVESMFLLALFYWLLVELCGVLGRWSEAKLSRFRFAPS